MASAIVDGVCETCRSRAGDTSIDASVPLLAPPVTVDLHARPVADDPHLLPTVKSDESVPDVGNRPLVDAPDPIPGVQLLGILGTGGSATVFRGRQLGANRECAVKFVNRTTHASAGDRLAREVRAIASLDHPNIIRVYSCDLEGPSPYLVMELAAGGSLADRLKANLAGLSIDESVTLAERVARGIAHAHEHGIVHRDIKPGNLLLDAEGQIKVSDFGLARNFDKDPTITKSQAILGTPAYMAPEQARSEEATPRSDVYGIGAVLYDCLTGRPPFPTRDYVETLTKVREEPPASPRSIRPAIPRDLEAICLKCLEKDPARRYASATELADDLARFRKGERTVARPVSFPAKIWQKVRKHSRSWATAAVVLLALLAGSAVWHNEPDRMRTQKEASLLLSRGKSLTLVNDRDLLVERFDLFNSAEIRRPENVKEWSALAVYSAGIGLLRRPGIESYTITGELCQQQRASEIDPEKFKAESLEQVGLILGFDSTTAGAKFTHYYDALYFTEFKKTDPLNQKTTINYMALTTARHEHFFAEAGGISRRGALGVHLSPPAKFPSWRQFAVKVSPNEIRFDCEGTTQVKPAETINGDRSRLYDERLKKYPQDSPTIYAPRPWDPKEMPIGLWIRGSWLSVRNLVVTPNP